MEFNQTMHDKYQKITEIMDRLETIQDAQISSFETELLPDLETQGIERKTGFEELQQAVGRFITIAEQERDSWTQEKILALDKRTRLLLKQNRTLYHKVKAHRDRLQDTLKGLNKGRKAIQAYGSPVSSRPRAISFTN